MSAQLLCRICPAFRARPTQALLLSGVMLLAALPAQAAGALGSLPDNMVMAGTNMASDLSPWSMYQQADTLVKGVMLGLLLASVITWTIGLAKLFELVAAKRRLQAGLLGLNSARNLNETEHALADESAARDLMLEALDELRRSGSHGNTTGIQERIRFRLERQIAACGRQMGKGTGVLASIGATAPFVGLFGTVWGIMNSFIGIAQTQSSNLAVVAPGIAEALLATAMGLVAAIPAVVLYNLLARAIGSYRAQLTDAGALVLLLVSRELDQPAQGQLPETRR